MTESTIESLIKIDEEIIEFYQTRLVIEPNEKNWAKLNALIKKRVSLIAEYREKRRFVNTCEKHLLGPEFEKQEDAVKWKEKYNSTYPYQKLATFKAMTKEKTAFERL